MLPELVRGSFWSAEEREGADVECEREPKDRGTEAGRGGGFCATRKDGCCCDEDGGGVGVTGVCDAKEGYKDGRCGGGCWGVEVPARPEPRANDIDVELLTKRGGQGQTKPERTSKTKENDNRFSRFSGRSGN